MFKYYNRYCIPKTPQKPILTLVRKLVHAGGTSADNEIIEFIFHQTNQTITRMALYNIRQQIKKESFDWYKSMREGQHEYIHEFKERVNEILTLQQRHYEIVDNDRVPTRVKQV